ncbi:hypothetical protein QVD17_16099 [Tagetes erecta]|uniref:Uncharacterized protein n=1 Tax=Tagetes erecta TaxID=13708 RepID=A0AAD8P0B6_TARER|nr:hypothetical protein QVD17_16099 [Tagetes erecta]
MVIEGGEGELTGVTTPLASLRPSTASLLSVLPLVETRRPFRNQTLDLHSSIKNQGSFNRKSKLLFSFQARRKELGQHKLVDVPTKSKDNLFESSSIAHQVNITKKWLDLGALHQRPRIWWLLEV